MPRRTSWPEQGFPWAIISSPICHFPHFPTAPDAPGPTHALAILFYTASLHKKSVCERKNFNYQQWPAKLLKSSDQVCCVPYAYGPISFIRPSTDKPIAGHYNGRSFYIPRESLWLVLVKHSQDNIGCVTLVLSLIVQNTVCCTDGNKVLCARLK